jgi:hypothetical protein
LKFRRILTAQIRKSVAKTTLKLDVTEHWHYHPYPLTFPSEWVDIWQSLLQFSLSSHKHSSSFMEPTCRLLLPFKLKSLLHYSFCRKWNGKQKERETTPAVLSTIPFLK